MKKAFVFGKFLPFHKGHEAMIHFALQQCDFLTILICCSDQEQISCAVRKEWIVNTFKDQHTIEVRVFNYLESELPNTSESSKEVSRLWAQTFKNQFLDYSFIITSEIYGNYVAEFMGVTHIPFDIPRNLVPVSATAVRNDIFLNWNFLPDTVKPYFVTKIVILGTESTGKTTLTKLLSDYFDCSLVLETGRELIENSNDFDYEDLYKVSKEHAKRINNALLGKSPLVLIDTDIHITKSYSRFVFGKELIVKEAIYAANRADVYIYLNNDVEHIQDGTRLSKSDRDKLDIFHREVLTENEISITEISGNWSERFNQAVLLIEKCIQDKKKDTS
ncbi:hypothetical protein GCM10022393_35320 [Aquimarina addita]|uniref:HTH-type transcriptional regulator, transcriptional repressor of NAD biosynthesis genes n=1 Tax=Aquimarina addita TaxID=870485 RepID=A0ABP6UTN9_9FLAO